MHIAGFLLMTAIFCGMLGGVKSFAVFAGAGVLCMLISVIFNRA